MNNLIDNTPPEFNPGEGSENSQQTVDLNLKPTIDNLDDSNKTSGGVLGLDIGVVDLGLISQSQIARLAENNRIHLTVEEGQTLDADLSVAIHTVLGGQAFDVGVYKKDENGNYARIDILSGSSGGALGFAKTERFTLETLEPGEYEFVLDLGAGLTVVQVADFQIYNKVLRDYGKAAEGIQVTGNVLDDWNTGGSKDATIVSDIRVGTKEGDQPTIEVEKDEKTVIQGEYGQLFISQDGSYEYIPANNTKNVGKVETFNYTVLNTHNNQSGTGDLKFRISGDTIEWEDDEENWDKVKPIVEAKDQSKKTSIDVSNKQDVRNVRDARSLAGAWHRGTITSDTFTIQDTKSVLEFDYRKKYNIGGTNARIHLIKVDGDSEEVVETIDAKFSRDRKKLTFDNLAPGEYKLTAKGIGTMGAVRGYLENITVTSSLWGQYDVADPDIVKGNLKDDSVTSENDNVKTELSVLGHLIDNGNVSSRESYHRFTNQRTEIKLSGKYGVLTVEENGEYTYKPNADVRIAGGTEKFKFKLTHASGLSDEAELTISIDELLTATTGDDVLVGTPANDTITGSEGSDTLVYNVHEEDSATGGNGEDVWNSFHFGTVAEDEEADRLDLRLLFEGENISETDSYLRLKVSEDGRSITIRVDRDGPGSKYGFADLITLNIKEGITLPDPISIQDLIEKGMIIVN